MIVHGHFTQTVHSGRFLTLQKKVYDLLRKKRLRLTMRLSQIIQKIWLLQHTSVAAAIANHPEDMVITTHVCRGNFHSTYASEGAYDPIAPYLFAKENVDAFYLEYDDARSGGFEPLKYIPEGKKVVLGLITTKSAELEDKNRIIRRIHDAARYVPLENLYLSPQCGFASTEEGNKLTEDEQWAKLALVKEIAESVWGN